MQDEDLTALREQGDKLIEIIKSDFRDVQMELRVAGSRLARVRKMIARLDKGVTGKECRDTISAILEFEDMVKEITIGKLAFTATSYMVISQILQSDKEEADDS